jgi:hypothetical protein
MKCVLKSTNISTAVSRVNVNAIYMHSVILLLDKVFVHVCVRENLLARLKRLKHSLR